MTSRPQLKCGILMDITGSMGSAWQGVHEAILKLINKICIEDDLPVQFVIVPYTELASKSFASWHEFDNPTDTINFVESIVLCHPPEAPHINASGGDTEENVKGGIAIIYKNIEQDIPYIWFHVTDAGWHYIGDTSPETKAELTFLDNLQIGTYDFFEIWNKLINKNKNIFWCSFQVRDTIIYHTYAQMTKQTNGFALSGLSNSINISNAMYNIVIKIISSLNGDSDNSIETLDIKGLNIYDCSSIKYRDNERQAKEGCAKLFKSPNDSSLFLETTIEQLVHNIKGIGWSHRAIHFNNIVIAHQMKLYGNILKYFTSDEISDQYIKILITNCYNYIPEDQKGHFSITFDKIKDIKDMLHNDSRSVPEEFRDCISYSTVAEVSEEITLEEIQTDFVKAILSTLMGYLTYIKFPSDKNGNPDFKSAWDGNISYIGIEPIAITSFISMFNSGNMKDPLTREECNSLIIISGNNGTIQNALYQVASMTQLLNFAQCYGIGSDINNGYIPNIVPGLLACMFEKLIRERWIQANYTKLQNVLHSIKALNITPAADIIKQLKNGQANPSDRISKMVCVWYREMPDNNDMLYHILTELLQTIIQKYFGKLTLDNNIKYNSYLKEFIDMECFKPFNEDVFILHPLENNNPSFITELEEYMSNGFINKIYSNKIFQEYCSIASIVETILNTDLAITNIVDLHESYGNLQFIQCLLYRFRTERYDMKDIEVIHQGITHVNKCHIRKQTFPTIAVQLVDKLKDIYMDIINERNTKRIIIIKKRLVQYIVDQLNTKMSKDKWNNILSNNYNKYNDKIIKLSRCEIFDMIPEIFINTKKLQLLIAIISGDWSSDVPQTLRSYISLISSNMTSSNYKQQHIDILISVIQKNEQCKRQDGYNRHGHSNSLQSPNPWQWTLLYNDHRIKESDAKRTKLYLNDMKIFTEIYQDYCTKSEQIDNLNSQLITDIVQKYSDNPNQKNKFVKEITRTYPQLA